MSTVDSKANVATRETREKLSPRDVLNSLRGGNERFATDAPLARDRKGEIGQTSGGQFPLAVLLACMDSRVPTETIFDQGIGDIFSIRVAGNIVTPEVLGSMEYGCAVAGAKLIVVLGHTKCGAVTATVNVEAGCGGDGPACDNLGAVVTPIAEVVRADTETTGDRSGENSAFVEKITQQNVRRSMAQILERSSTLKGLVDSGEIDLVGGVYDVATGRVEFLEPS